VISVTTETRKSSYAPDQKAEGSVGVGRKGKTTFVFIGRKGGEILISAYEGRQRSDRLGEKATF